MPPTGGHHVASRYNFSIPIQDGILIYNANSGAVLRLHGQQAHELAELLCTNVVQVESDCLDGELKNDLTDGGFLVESGVDETAVIRKRFEEARGSTPLVLTLTTTMDCNLGCFYCYEKRTTHELTTADIPAIVESARERLREHSKKSLHVDWYGGEPLLNIVFLESASVALQAMCLDEGVVYHASVISNGTVWPEDVGGFLSRHRIRQVQVSFDGMAENHNRRRRFRNLESPYASQGSFDLIATLVDRLLDHVRVDLRFNADSHNQGDLLPFVEFAKERGWFSRKFPAVIQPARLAAYTDHASFLRKTEMHAETYDVLRDSVRAWAGTKIRVEESEVPDGFPYPKTSVCAALAFRSEVFGADGLTYRCGLQVGDERRAVGAIRPEEAKRRFPDLEWWNAFDPTMLPNCSRCSFLPICWGGCPKKHLDRDQHALDEQSQYWRTNLPRLVAARFGCEPPPGYAYGEADQFR